MRDMRYLSSPHNCCCCNISKAQNATVSSKINKYKIKLELLG